MRLTDTEGRAEARAMGRTYFIAERSGVPPIFIGTALGD